MAATYLTSDQRTALEALIKHRQSGSAGNQNCLDTRTGKFLTDVFGQKINGLLIKDKPITALLEALRLVNNFPNIIPD